MLGYHVTAWLCMQAGCGQTLISETVRRKLAAGPGIAPDTLAPLTVKGKRRPIPVYEVRSVPAPEMSLSTDAA